MGYNTDFEGGFIIAPALKPEHKAYLEAFSCTRRMKRNAELVSELPDLLREAVGLPVGADGGFYVGNTEDFGQNHTSDIANYNKPPKGQPGLWCNWRPNKGGNEICTEGEKFYDYVPWLHYLIDNFLTPWGYKLYGEVNWFGEETSDIGKIVVKGDQVKVFTGKIEYVEDNS